MFALETQVATDNPDIQFPLIHSNGNSGTALGKQYLAALTFLSAFQEKLSQIEFHPRDYYPMGDDAWLKARAQWEVQQANIRSVAKFLDLHVGHCFESAK